MNIGGKVLQKNGSGNTQKNYGWETGNNITNLFASFGLKYLF